MLANDNYMICGINVVKSLDFSPLQVSTGWIPMVAALLMPSRSSVTLKTAAVPPALIPKTGYALYTKWHTQPSQKQRHIVIINFLDLLLIVNHYELHWLCALIFCHCVFLYRVLVQLMYQRSHIGLFPTSLER